MRSIKAIAFFVAGLCPGLAAAQVYLPPNVGLPPQSVIGNTLPQAGDAVAVSFARLKAALNVPAVTTCATSNWIRALAAGGAVTCSQPALTDISGFGANVTTFLATPSSANLGAMLTDETGTGAAVFANSPILISPNLGSPSSVGTMPAFTLGGAVSGGGNNINNVNVGASSPGTGAFTSITAPIHGSSTAIQFQTNGSTFAGNVTAGQQWYFGTTNVTPASGVRATVSNNTATAPALNLPATLSVVAADTARPVIGIQGFTSQPGALVYGHANGTAAAPTATLSGNAMGLFVAYGYHTAGTPGYGQSGAGSGFQMIATDNFTDIAAGSKIETYTTPTGTVAIALASTFQASGGFSVGTVVDPGIGGIIANTTIKSQGATSGIGYATGAGGGITQITSRTTGVTLNTVAGAITLFSAAGSATPATFTVTNSAVAATDVVIVNQKSGTDKYEIFVTNVSAGSFQITFFTTGGTNTEQPVFNFAIIKAVAN